MSVFNRGLDDAFVAAFNKEYDKGGWLNALVDDEEIFVAIRENYVSFYYRGCSLLQLVLQAGTMIGKIHYKYLLRPDSDNPYIKVVDGQPDLPSNTKSWLISDFDDIGVLKRAAKPHVVDEKVGVHDIICANPNIIDVEIAFGTGQTDEAGPQTQSIDFAAMQESNTDARLVFFEAKRFGNHAELRKSDDDVPKVVRQIERYSRELKQNHDAVIASYRHVCGNMIALRGVAKQYEACTTMLERIADGSGKLSVDVKPKLAVFGFDADQEDGTRWRPHHDKLRKLLDGRVLLCGNSKNFKRGISK